MSKFSFKVVVLLVSAFAMSNAHANCEKTLMGSDCAQVEQGTSSHMRGNAVANSKASKALKEAHEKGRKAAAKAAMLNKK